MNRTIRFFILVLSVYFLASCSFLQKIKGQFEDRPQIEGEGLEDISTDKDIYSDQAGSDSGNIEGLRTVYFDLDSSGLTEEAKALLNSNKVWFDNNPNVKKIVLEGHCDPLGSEAYNVGLGERRARVVLSYLKSIGLGGDKMSIISYGEEKLFSETDNHLNRRVNFVPQY